MPHNSVSDMVEYFGKLYAKPLMEESVPLKPRYGSKVIVPRNLELFFSLSCWIIF